MKNRIACLWIVLLIFTSSVFSQEKTPNVHLVFETKNSKGETATLSKITTFGESIEIGRAKPDGNGLLKFSFTAEKPERLKVAYNAKMSSDLFLRPTTDYHFFVDYDNPTVEITNGNKKGIVNLFLQKWKEKSNAFTYKGKKLWELEQVDKIAGLDKRAEVAQSFLKEFTAAYSPSEEDYYFMDNYLHNDLLADRFNRMEGVGAFKNLKEMVTSEEMNKLSGQIRLEPEFLRIAPSDYSNSLFYYSRFLAIKSFVENNNASTFEDITSDMYLNFMQGIPSLAAPEEIKAFLLAQQITDFLDDKEMYTNVMPVMQDNYPDSEYTSMLKAMFAQANRLDGQPAPDIKGVTVSGDTATLSSLKGKVVYVDFWATWCGPCQTEFPKSIELKKQFEGRDDVVFMYVSIDEQKDKWQKYVAENPQLKGLHINGRDDYREGFGKVYGIGGIPHYVLINKEGIVVESNAPRPSDERTATLINEQF